VRSDIVVCLPFPYVDKVFNPGLPYSLLHLNFLGPTFMNSFLPIYSISSSRVLSKTI
jgi:hypothetical protein